MTKDMGDLGRDGRIVRHSDSQTFSGIQGGKRFRDVRTGGAYPLMVTIPLPLYTPYLKA